MPMIAVIGAGALGGALAHKLAARGRVGEVRLIDPEAKIAEGKALDILQSSPIEGWSTRVSSAGSFAAAAGASAIVLAELVTGGEISGEPGLALLRQLARIETSSPILFAGPSQRELMARAIDELHLSSRRLVGSAPLALESAVTAVVAAMMDLSPMNLSIGIAGVPPQAAVIAWGAATAFHQPISSVLAPHEMAAISSRLPGLWPPAPYALASAAARIAEALTHGSRQRYTCYAAMDTATAGRHIVAAAPVEIERGGIKKVMEPALSAQERTTFENGLARTAGDRKS